LLRGITGFSLENADFTGCFTKWSGSLGPLGRPLQWYSRGRVGARIEKALSLEKHLYVFQEVLTVKWAVK
jgi:hypothetical protein